MSQVDFTIKVYRKLLETLRDQGFLFYRFSDYLGLQSHKSVVIRHDIDLHPKRALQVALIEHKYGVKGSYYFRSVKESWNERIICKIAEMGHEVGYHYEDFVFARQKTPTFAKAPDFGRHSRLRPTKSAGRKGKIQRGLSEHDYERELAEIAIESFVNNLARLRKLVPVKTICMHGSPLSRWDSRLLWKYYDYRDFDISAEPYFDINFEEMLYLTDTGRRWNGESVSVRDKSATYGHYNTWKVKPVPGSLMNMTAKANQFQSEYNFRTTGEIIRSIELPDRLMLTLHPQRWTDRPIPWIQELVWQNVKNIGKYYLIKMRPQQRQTIF